MKSKSNKESSMQKVYIDWVYVCGVVQKQIQVGIIGILCNGFDLAFVYMLLGFDMDREKHVQILKLLYLG